MTPLSTAKNQEGGRLVLRKGGWFAILDDGDWSGPWSSLVAAQCAANGDFEQANALDVAARLTGKKGE